jgi:hypothetical protein
MSIAIQSDEAESLRDKVQGEYAPQDHEVPDEEAEATFTITVTQASYCCNTY